MFLRNVKNEVRIYGKHYEKGISLYLIKMYTICLYNNQGRIHPIDFKWKL